MWSAGVLLFGLLGGYPPFDFDGPADEKLHSRIRAAEYQCDPRWWGAVSPDAIGLIASLLVVNPDVRLSATQALRHPWMTDDSELCERVVAGALRIPSQAPGRGAAAPTFARSP